MLVLGDDSSRVTLYAAGKAKFESFNCSCKKKARNRPKLLTQKKDLCLCMPKVGMTLHMLVECAMSLVVG
jgi:hypothetical protein